MQKGADKRRPCAFYIYEGQAIEPSFVIIIHKMLRHVNKFLKCFFELFHNNLRFYAIV